MTRTRTGGDREKPGEASSDGAARLLHRLRARLAEEGLNIVLPLSRAAFDDLSRAGGLPGMHGLLAAASGAVVVGDGGPAFFARFQRARRNEPSSRHPHPLDEYTRTSIGGAVRDVCGVGQVDTGVPFRILYPFATESAALPFQRLGMAAGLPPPGPLGLQVHPIFGPWWAYRALVVVAASLELGGPLAAPCDDCSRPCEVACPAGAVASTGFSVGRCVARRGSDPGCHQTCAARLQCPVGDSHQYPTSQLAFHMTASLAQIRTAGRPVT